MRPIVTERGGDGGGSRTLGVVERGRRPGTEAGPGGGRVQRQHRGRSMTKCGSGGAEVEEAARQVCGRNFFFIFSCKKKEWLRTPHANCDRARQRRRRWCGGLVGAKDSVVWAPARHRGGGPMADVHGGDNRVGM
jgi:hypothetical protein